MDIDYLKSPEDVVYDNQPLSEVSMEIRFRGELSIEQKRADFYKKIRSEYSDIQVPHANAGVAPALQHYRFRNPENKDCIQLAIHSYSYSQKKYSGYKSFISEALKHYKFAHELFGINEFTRIGWRYSNVLPIVRESGFIPIKNVFKNSIVSFSLMDMNYKNMNFSSTFSLHKAIVNLNVVAVVNSVDKSEALVLDTDVYFDNTCDHSIELGKIDESFDYLHRIGRNIFESTITDEYRKFLKGEFYD